MTFCHTKNNKTDILSCFTNWYKFGTINSKQCLIKIKEYYVLHN
jgi:hypothetical protein